MNASATIRASYIRQARMSMEPRPRLPSIISDTTIWLEPRPATDEKLNSFIAVNHLEHREKCNEERFTQPTLFDVENNYLDSGASFMDWTDVTPNFRKRLKTMETVFPYRDPVYLVAILFLLGSIDLVINAFFDLLPRTIPSTAFESEETTAVPATVLIGSILFFAAGVFDTFGALNADRGTLETSKTKPGKVTYRPALLGTPEFRWIPSWKKAWELTISNLAFQAGLIVLIGGVVFMFAGIVDFPGLVPESTPFFSSIVFGPQIIHGVMFFVANVMLAISEQKHWYKPKFRDPDWQGAFLNAVGGFGFMMAGFFLYEGGKVGELRSAVAAMVGSWAFLVGSLVRWYVVMEFW
ncbi:hypothetical protein EJ02DRAFT_459686 [Clathrospora elynae]|uniref:Integral membrane protein n=1 Tax=Clathrospora elynae TaxID=706981 RepID=A0A6A5SFT2_9PLEO|nr:hypothetical protein EJ02DRAFT_459686 [Clathrospora elynae]